MKHHMSKLEGKTIARVTSLTADDIKEMYWYCDPVETSVIEFTDGSCVLVMADPEGNGPGFLDYQDA
jgi:hypothetical protein